MKLEKISFSFNADELNFIQEAFESYIVQFIKDEKHFQKNYKVFIEEHQDTIEMVQEICSNHGHEFVLYPSDVEGMKNFKQFDTAFDYCEFVFKNSDKMK